MKILVRRWFDDPGFTLTQASDQRRVPDPIANDWSGLASNRGADQGCVIVFSKEENLYSHNTMLTAKKINSILKLSKVTQMEKGDMIILNIKYMNIHEIINS